MQPKIVTAKTPAQISNNAELMRKHVVGLWRSLNINSENLRNFIEEKRISPVEALIGLMRYFRLDQGIRIGDTFGERKAGKFMTTLNISNNLSHPEVTILTSEIAEFSLLFSNIIHQVGSDSLRAQNQAAVTFFANLIKNSPELASALGECLFARGLARTDIIKFYREPTRVDLLRLLIAVTPADQLLVSPRGIEATDSAIRALKDNVIYRGSDLGRRYLVELVGDPTISFETRLKACQAYLERSDNSRTFIKDAAVDLIAGYTAKARPNKKCAAMLLEISRTDPLLVGLGFAEGLKVSLAESKKATVKWPASVSLAQILTSLSYESNPVLPIRELLNAMPDSHTIEGLQIAGTNIPTKLPQDIASPGEDPISAYLFPLALKLWIREQAEGMAENHGDCARALGRRAPSVATKAIVRHFERVFKEIPDPRIIAALASPNSRLKILLAQCRADEDADFKKHLADAMRKSSPKFKAYMSEIAKHC